MKTALQVLSVFLFSRRSLLSSELTFNYFNITCARSREPGQYPQIMGQNDPAHFRTMMGIAFRLQAST